MEGLIKMNVKVNVVSQSSKCLGIEIVKFLLYCSEAEDG